MKNYYITLEPELKLREKINVLKKQIKKKYKNITFVDDPPHITIAVKQGLFSGLNLFDSYNLKPYHISISGWDILPKNVLICKISNPDPLRILQGFIISNIRSDLDYPFIGKGWNPHITIAECSAFKDITSIKLKCPIGSWKCDSICIREVGSNKLIKRWELR